MQSHEHFIRKQKKITKGQNDAMLTQSIYLALIAVLLYKQRFYIKAQHFWLWS